jgi:hypothetical protein
MKTCKVAGCEGNIYVKERCCTHYRKDRFIIDEEDRKKRIVRQEKDTRTEKDAMTMWDRAVGL